MIRREAGDARSLEEPVGKSRRPRGPPLKHTAYERSMAERWTALEYRLTVLETVLQRLERRMWLTIVGVAGVVLSEAAASLLMLPRP